MERRHAKIRLKSQFRIYWVFTKHLFLRFVFSLFSTIWFFFFSFYLVVSCSCVYFVQNTNQRKHAKDIPTQKKVQMLFVKLTFSDLFLSLFHFHFILFILFVLYVHLKPYVCILFCVRLARFIFFFFVFDSVFVSKWIENRIYFLETPARALNFKKNIYTYLDIGIHRCI